METVAYYQVLRKLLLYPLVDQIFDVADNPPRQMLDLLEVANRREAMREFLDEVERVSFLEDVGDQTVYCDSFHEVLHIFDLQLRQLLRVRDIVL